jgi:hypothetical protein
MCPRVLSVLGGLLWLLATSPGPENSSAFAQNTDAKTADQQSTGPNSAKEAQTVEFAEAQRLLNGPAGNPECVSLGRRVISLLWRDDLETACRHLVGHAYLNGAEPGAVQHEIPKAEPDGAHRVSETPFAFRILIKEFG